MIYRFTGILILLTGFFNPAHARFQDHSTNSIETSSPTLLALSEELLLAVRYTQPTDSLQGVLADTPYQKLLDELRSDTQKKTFWVNLYNAGYQILYTDLALRPNDIFTEKALIIAGIPFSLDDIEHGVLRKYRHKYSLGYMPMWFPEKHIKELAVNEIDWRIHFALNCGAKSCPPIAFYHLDKLEQQLDLATTSFLSEETFINDAEKTISVTKIMFWFKGDFGGSKGIKKILGDLFSKDVSRYKMDYQDYDWTAKLGYFVEESE